MQYMTVMNTLYRGLHLARYAVRLVAKWAAWLYGIQAGILFALAVAADKPLPYSSSPVIHFAVALAVMHLAPRFIDATIRALVANCAMRRT